MPQHCEHRYIIDIFGAGDRVKKIKGVCPRKTTTATAVIVSKTSNALALRLSLSNPVAIGTNIWHG